MRRSLIPNLFPGIQLRKVDGSPYDSRSVWVYLIGLSGGVIKVGKTTNPRERLRGHWGLHTPNFKWAHLFGGGCRDFGRLAERYSVDALAEISADRHCRERFVGIEKAAAIEVVRSAICRARKVVEAENEKRSKLEMLAMLKKLEKKHQAEKRKAAKAQAPDQQQQVG